MADGPEPRIEARAVSYAAGGRLLIDQVSLAAYPGEFLVVAGPNGAGKSTLLRLLAGELVPASGEVRLASRPLRGMTPLVQARERAVLPQQAAVSFPFTARDVVLLGRHPHIHRRSAETASDHAVVDRALAQVEATPLAYRLFPTLSGGEQGRVSLARVLAQECPVLLLDEPTAALDIRHQQLALALAREVARAGGTVIAVLHDLNLAALATSVALLRDGQLAALGPPASVLTAAILGDVFGHPVHVLAGPDGLPVVVPARSGGPAGPASPPFG
jgi:iron complex transport system ATP-binding protein